MLPANGDMENKEKEIVILYEDENILVINKPAGLMVHADGRSKEETLSDWILAEHPNLYDVGEDIILSSGEVLKRPGIVHRLDKETSGVLVIAKREESFLYLKSLFRERGVVKRYCAVVYGVPKERIGVIEKSLGRSVKDFRLRAVEGATRGELRMARTEYKVRESFNEYAFLDVYPRTGRTHQIRVHLKSIAHPILCDALYAPKRECPKALGRLGLHAEMISFKGQDGEDFSFEAPLPSAFLRFREILLKR